MDTIIIENNLDGNGQTTRQTWQANGTPGELKDARPGDLVKVEWDKETEHYIGPDGRLWVRSQGNR